MKPSTNAARTVLLCSDTAQRHTQSSPIRVSLGIASEPLKAAQPHLTERQLEVLSLLCEGLPNKLICRQLNIAAGTVKVHISSILRELGVSSRLQAVVVARRTGLIGDAGERLPQHVIVPLQGGARPLTHDLAQSAA